MRGDDQQHNHIFSYLSPEARVRKDHPLRASGTMEDDVLSQVWRRLDAMYAPRRDLTIAIMATMGPDRSLHQVSTTSAGHASTGSTNGSVHLLESRRDLVHSVIWNPKQAKRNNQRAGCCTIWSY